MRWNRVLKIRVWLLSLKFVVLLVTVECVYRTTVAREPALPQKVESPSIRHPDNR